MTTQNAARRPRVALLTLGCAKNLVDSEQIATILHAGGADVVHSLAEADVAVVNTCGFIRPAKEESIDVILEAVACKTDGRLKAVVVTGCLSQRYASDLKESMPEVDALIGIDPASAARAALAAAGLCGRPAVGPTMRRAVRLTPPAWSYLRISHGCGNRCAYCAIPLIRGPLRSRPREEVLEEARCLVEQGVRELNVIGQDTASYGMDVDGRPVVHSLLHDLCGIDGLRWVRLLYVHPAHVYDGLIEVLASEDKVCPYVDVPLQHINDGVLKRMGRKIGRGGIERLIRRLRDSIPGVTLRTTFMTGFPGETDAAFDELLEFVEEARFDRLGCFAYSPEEGTPAAALPDQVPQKLQEERRDRLMSLQQQIAFDLAAGRVGQRTLVLTEEGEPTEQGLRPARSAHEAPDVDPVIYVPEDAAPAPGRFVEVEIVGSAGYDCIATVLPEHPDAR